MKKESYTEAELEITVFDTIDIITASDGPDHNDGDVTP